MLLYSQICLLWQQQQPDPVNVFLLNLLSEPLVGTATRFVLHPFLLGKVGCGKRS
jgi:hypothetical protein